MIRKHIKRESARWYYHCDRLGMLVWQDAVRSVPFHGRGPKGEVKKQGLPPAEGHKSFECELFQMLEDLHNHPAIIQWIVFNEGWGQYNDEDTKRLTLEVMQESKPAVLPCQWLARHRDWAYQRCPQIS